jgi:hypothetical protein
MVVVQGQRRGGSRSRTVVLSEYTEAGRSGDVGQELSREEDLTGREMYSDPELILSIIDVSVTREGLIYPT